MSEAGEWLEVAPGEAGRRLDVFLAERLALSRTGARRLLASGAVRIGGRALAEGDKGLALGAGERVEVAAAARADAERIPQEPEAALRVLALGPGWLVADKPAGVPVHPLAASERGTLLGAVAARHPEIQGIGEGGLRSGVVHRLDVDTSGALLLAIDAAQWRRLRSAFREHRVDKRYRALALGHVAADGEIELPLAIARHRPAFVRAAHPGERTDTRRTVTAWRVLERLRGATLLEVRTVTGFLHQVRATLAHLGHPLAGDRTYAPDGDATGAARHMLHARSLAFEEIRAESPDPRDFAESIAALR
ncbi:MAG TPA: RluA family pseudouridine synthase [Myxococcota bacterium]|nr:RluA family pseudouridine synthase [Myxococcota bacterium]